MHNLIAETNGTRATYLRTNLVRTSDIRPGDEITLPVIAWDSEGFALIADDERGRLVRAQSAVVRDATEDEPCTFMGLDRQLAATGPLDD